MKVDVRNNNVDQAIKILKRKLMREGVLREFKKRAFYVGPAESKRVKHEKAVKRQEKANIKRRAAAEGMSVKDYKALLPL